LGGRIVKLAARLLAPMAVGRQLVVSGAVERCLAASWAVKAVLLLELAFRQMYPGERPVEG